MIAFSLYVVAALEAAVGSDGKSHGHSYTPAPPGNNRLPTTLRPGHIVNSQVSLGNFMTYFQMAGSVML